MDENINKNDELKDENQEFFIEPKNAPIEPKGQEINNVENNNSTNSEQKIVQNEPLINTNDNQVIITEPKVEIIPEQKDTNSLELLLENVEEFSKQKKEHFSININSFDDIVKMILNNEYDYLIISPEYEKVKIIFKKDEKDEEEKFINYPIYSNILVKIKSLVNIDSDNRKPQEGKGKYTFDKKIYDLDISTIPESFGEKITIKIIQKVKTKPSINEALTFTGALSFIIFILSSSFITFVVMKAQNVADVIFFSSLGISLNDINAFIGKVVNLVFSSSIFLEVIFFAVFGIKFIMTKKEFRKKRFIYGIIAFILLLSTFTSGNLWILTVKKVKSLPNWQEMSYGEIQLYDNTKLLLDKKFSKADALIKETEYGSLIGPVTIKFDLTYYAKKEENNSTKIVKYIWDFGDGEIKEELTPIVIKEFNEKKTYNIKVSLELKQLNGKTTIKEVDNMPKVGIKNLVIIKEDPTNSGGKKVSFDASDLGNLGKIEWYTEENLDTPILVGERFTYPKVIFSDTTIGLYIRKEGKTNLSLDKVFLINGLIETKINGIIEETRTDNDLTYEFVVKDVKKGIDDGFIESYKWIIGENEKILKNIEGKEEESSKIKHTFIDYGKKEVKVILTDSYGKTKEITKIINVIKNTKLKNNLSIYDDGNKIDPRYENNIYYIQDLLIPTTLKFDARSLKTDNPMDSLQKVTWELDSKTKIGNIFVFKMEYEGRATINAKYTFKNIKDSSIKEISDIIYINSIKKDALLDLEIKPSEEEYVPITIQFDASKSEIKDENITKFIFDYGDGTTPEEKDAVNKGHRYTIPGNYTIKLTAVTSSGKEYYLTKKLILKPRPQLIKINTSLKEAPIYQGIDFSSAGSEGQIISYFWDFGDNETSSDANPTHAYKESGTYKAKLKIEFENRNVLEDSVIIQVTE
ncbi:MAG: ATPase, T2SS/T4P/T4SS family [Candidatus Gracilibacteria bacterium]